MIKLSPSNLDYYKHCSCFKFKEYKREGSAAEEGTALHRALETDDDSELNAEQQRRVQQTRDLVESQKTAYLGWDDNDPVNFRMHHEEKMKTSTGLSGKMDRCYVNLKTRKALVFDAKYGRLGLIAEAEDSMQMKNYADIVFFRYPNMVDEVLCILGSPRTDEVSSHVYKVEEWPKLQKEIQDVIDSVENPFKSPCFNDAICAKCDFIDKCPAVKPVAIVPASSAALTVDTSFLMKPVEELSVEELAKNRALIDLLDAWAEKRKPEIDNRVFGEGIELPGYTKVKKEGAAYIPAEESERAYELLKDELTPEQYIRACGKPSISKLVEMLTDDAPGGSVAERKRAAKEHVLDKVEEVVRQQKSSEYLRRKAKLDLKLIGG